VHLLALNNTWLPSSNTVLTLRFGWTQFRDDDTLSMDFDPASAGLRSAFGSAIQTQKFPRGQQHRLRDASAPSTRPTATSTRGAPTPRCHRLIGRHTVKIGADYRTIGRTRSRSRAARASSTSTAATPRPTRTSNGVNGANPSGNALASLLLGYPSGDPGNQSRINVSAPANYFLRYYGAYIQDDFRVNSKLTINGWRAPRARDRA
jgi:hypothetical protein